jgi:hypothetical protein
MSSTFWCNAIARQSGGEDILPQAPQRLLGRSTGHHHRSAEMLQGGHAGDPAQRGTSATSRCEQSRRKLPPADAPTRTADAGIQATRVHTTLPCHVWSDRATLPPATLPPPRPEYTVKSCGKKFDSWQEITSPPPPHKSDAQAAVHLSAR